jgi:hypothetical protein
MRPTREQSLAQRKTLLDCAEQIFYKKGFANTTLVEIASNTDARFIYAALTVFSADSWRASKETRTNGSSRAWWTQCCIACAT